MAALAQGKSLNEIETFCQAFMTELSKHIGEPEDLSTLHSFAWHMSGSRCASSRDASHRTIMCS